MPLTIDRGKGFVFALNVNSPIDEIEVIEFNVPPALRLPRDVFMIEVRN